MSLRPIGLPASANGEGNGSSVATADTPMRSRHIGEAGYIHPIRVSRKFDLLGC